MTVLSILRAGQPAASFGRIQTLQETAIRNLRTTGGKFGGGHNPNKLDIVPSRYQWHKYKDQFHFYLFLGVIPLSALVFYANVFIGPATLTEIPPGYVPQQWEYYRNPITRFFARYIIDNQQERYERNLFYIKESDEKRRMRLLAWKVEKLMRERADYPNYFTTQTYLGQYARNMHIERDYIMSTTGEE